MCSVAVSAQTTNPFPTTDSLRKFINKWIRNSAVDAFTNLRLNTALIGVTRFIDSTVNSSSGVDTFYAVSSNTARLVTTDGRTMDVTLSGGGGTNVNVGVGYRLAVPGTNNIKTIFASWGVSADSTANTNGITFRVDSSTLAGYFLRRKDSLVNYVTPSQLSTGVAGVLPSQSGNAYKMLRTDGSTGSWQNPFEWVDIRTFGAVGDSLVDCTTPIQNAINSLPSTGGTIYIPDGKWKVTGKITVTKPVYFRGASGPIRSYQTGAHSAVLAEGRTTIYYTSDADTCLLIQRNATQMSDLSIKYSGSNVNRTAVGIYYDSATDMRMTNVGLLNFSVNMEVENGFQWLVDKCAFIDHKIVGLKVSDSLLHDAGDQSVMDCYFNVNTSFGNGSTHLYWRSGGGLRITNNKFNGAGGGNYPQYSIYAPFLGTVDFLCVGNSFENFTQSAIFVQPPATVQTGSLVISSNQFASYNNTKVTPDLVLDGSIAASLHNISVTGNIFLGNNTDTAVSIKSVQDLTFMNNQTRGYATHVYNNGLGARNNMVPPDNLQTLTFGTTTILDPWLGATPVLTLTGNSTIQFKNAFPGQKIKLIVSQDGTGGRTLSIPGFDIIGNTTLINPVPSTTSVVDITMYASGTAIPTNTARSWPTGTIPVYNSGFRDDASLQFDVTNKRLSINASTTPLTQLNISSDVNNSANGILLEQHSANNAGNRISFRKSYGTRASPSVGASGNYNAMLAFDTHDGAAYRTTASLSTLVQGSISTGIVPVGFAMRTGNSDVPDPVGSNLVNFWFSPRGNLVINNNITDVGNGYKLYVNGSVGIEKDSIGIVTTLNGKYIPLLDTTASATDSNRLFRISASDLAAALSVGGSPSLTQNYIGVGNGSNQLSGSSAYQFASGLVKQESSGAANSITSTTAVGSTSGGDIRLFAKNTPTATDQRLGGVMFGTLDGGTTENVVASIQAFTTGAHTPGSTETSNIRFYTQSAASPNEVMRLTHNGRVGIATVTPTARLHLPQGTSSAQNAPLKFTLGTNMTTAEAGAMEYDGTDFYITPGDATRRKIVAIQNASNSNSDIILWNSSTSTWVQGRSVSFTAFDASQTITPTSTSLRQFVSSAPGVTNITLTLNPGFVGQILTFKKTDNGSGTVTIDPAGSSTIDGTLTYVLSTQWESVSILYDGSVWFVISQ